MYKPVKHDQAELLETVNADPAAKAEYEAAQAEFAIIDAMREAVAHSGLTQQQIADRMGSTQSNLSRILNRTRTPNWKTACRLFKATGATVQKITLTYR